MGVSFRPPDLPSPPSSPLLLSPPGPSAVSICPSTCPARQCSLSGSPRGSTCADGTAVNGVPWMTRGKMCSLEGVVNTGPPMWVGGGRGHLGAAPGGPLAGVSPGVGRWQRGHSHGLPASPRRLQRVVGVAAHPGSLLAIPGWGVWGPILPPHSEAPSGACLDHSTCPGLPRHPLRARPRVLVALRFSTPKPGLYPVSQGKSLGWGGGGHAS